MGNPGQKGALSDGGGVILIFLLGSIEIWHRAEPILLMLIIMET